MGFQKCVDCRKVKDPKTAWRVCEKCPNRGG